MNCDVRKGLPDRESRGHKVGWWHGEMVVMMKKNKIFVIKQISKTLPVNINELLGKYARSRVF